MSVLFYSFIIAAVLSCIDFILFLMTKKQDGQYKKPIKTGILLLVSIPFLVSVYLYFFQAWYTSFECSKKTMTCTHSYATEYNKTIRPLAVYDLSPVRQAKTERHKFKRGNSYFTVILCDGNETLFTLPKHFPSNHDAKKEASRFNHFLSSKQKSYLFSEPPPDISAAQSFLMLGSVLFIIVVFIHICLLLNILFKKPEDKKHSSEKEQKK
ncbi:MAG: hypothetical protein IJ752_00135 [Alphaproteobacteria bacterium]|nr:hypothetical protein [Alphaproteobacteria bacterium]